MACSLPLMASSLLSSEAMTASAVATCSSSVGASEDDTSICVISGSGWERRQRRGRGCLPGLASRRKVAGGWRAYSG